MPLACITQYFYAFSRDMERFCITNEEGSAELRQKYKILYAYSTESEKLDNLVEDILNIEASNLEKDVKAPEQKIGLI